MLLFLLMTYITTLYLRPAEIFSSLSDVRVVAIASIITAIGAVVSLALRPRPIADHPLDKAVLGFWAAIVLSNVAWGWFGGGYAGFTDFLPVVMTYFLVRAAVRKPGQLRAIIVLLVVLNLVQAINAIVEFHTGIGLGGVTAVQGTRVRGTGIFNDPNDLAMSLVVAVPLVMTAIALRGRVLWRALGLAVLGLMLVAILYTSSRGAVLGLAVMALAYASARAGRMVAVVCAAAVFAALTVAGPSRASEINAGEESAQNRVQAWSAGLEMLKQRPLFGVGYGQFTEYHELVAHNSLVHSFAELGLFGELWFVSLFYWFFKSVSARVGGGSGVWKTWSTPLRASGVGLLVCVSFLSRQYVVVPYVLFALGASYAAMAQRHGTALSWTVRDLVKIGVLSVGFVATTYIAVRLLAVWS